jgi:hypothetical protein
MGEMEKKEARVASALSEERESAFSNAGKYVEERESEVTVAARKSLKAVRTWDGAFLAGRTVER